uniref:Fibronectin type-III domain-containing protein n=1 Tax=Sphenodon punctatus TaxID=8508 RepID=A0A8D0G8V6_SPHPU
MADTEVSAVEKPALGRPLYLGMLYDCRTDTSVPGIILWDNETLKRDVETKMQPRTEFRIVASDSIEDKVSALNISASLKASFLGGLVEADGSALFLKDSKKSGNQARVTLQYSTTTKFEHLTMSQLGAENVSYPAVFEQGTATHVVTAVLYGAQAFFVFDREVSASETVQKIEGNMKLMIEKIPKISGGGEVSGKMDKSKTFSAEDFRCTFYGDFSLENNPVNYQDAMQIYSTLPNRLGENGEKAVPVRVWLYPLTKLDSRAAKLVREISLALVYDAQAAMEHLTELDVRCNDLVKNLISTTFPEIKRKIQQFQDLCKQHRQTFQKALARVLPAIRGGGKEEGVLVDLLTSLAKSPFCAQRLNEFMDMKQQEMNFVNSYLRVLQGVEVISSQSELQQIVLDPRHDFVLCFTLTSLQDEESYLSDLNIWLRREFMEKTHHLSSRSKQWFENEKIRQKARNSARPFSDFARVNNSNGKTRFIVASIPDRDNPGASIFLYEKAELASSNFEPPSKPLPPVIDGISHDSVRLTFKPAESGRASIASYRVEYRIVGQENWVTVNTKDKPETFTVTGLAPNTEYQFRYAAVSKPGLSHSSDGSDAVKTLPTSAPGKPKKVAVGSSTITLCWERPSIVGVGAALQEYRVEYTEEAGGDSHREMTSRWSEQRTGARTESFQVNGLRPRTVHRFRVTAVCADGAMSRPSEETSLSTLKVWENLPVTTEPSDENAAVVMPALGRPFQLGMLYDCRSDTLLPGVTLWDAAAIEKDVVIRVEPKCESQLITSDFIADKVAALSLAASLKASFLGGLVEVGGSAGYLMDTKTFPNQARVTLHYSTETRHETLTMNHLGAENVSDPAVLDQGSATHAVGAVLYGAQAFFVFDQKAPLSENIQAIEENMQRIIEKIPKTAGKGEGAVKLDEETKVNAESFRCTFHSDFSLESKPKTYQDALKIYSTLPKRLGENGEKAVPVRVWLYPLKQLDSRAAQMVREVHAEEISHIETTLQQLIECDVSCNDLMKDKTTTTFPEMKRKFQSFKVLCMKYRQLFQKQLSAILPSLRRGESREDALMDTLTSILQSPFSVQHLTEFLGIKQQELNYVKFLLNLLKDVDIISSTNELQKNVLDPTHKNVVQFTFTSLHEETYLTDLKRWLCAPFTRKTYDPAPTPSSSGSVKAESEQWFKCAAIARKVHESAKTFSDFTKVNKSSGASRFIVASVPDESNPGASIYLYENGVLINTQFEPPSQPFPPLIDGISHDSVRLTFNPAESGRDVISSYWVEYRVVGQESWITVDTKDKRETFLVTGLAPKTEYQFRYAAVSKPGLSESSDVSDAVKTFPTSPPRKPVKAAVESSTVTVRWQRPSIIGDGASIAEYRVEYKEEAGDGIHEGKDKWSEMRTGNKTESCQISGLRPQTRYRVRVSAVCADGAMSDPSEETVLETGSERVNRNPSACSSLEKSRPWLGATASGLPDPIGSSCCGSFQY